MMILRVPALAEERKNAARSLEEKRPKNNKKQRVGSNFTEKVKKDVADGDFVFLISKTDT